MPLYEHFMSHKTADAWRGLGFLVLLAYAIWVRVRLFRAERELREKDGGGK